MILADTSVWIDHLHGRGSELLILLRKQRVFLHAMVLGELLTGGLPDRALTIGSLRRLPLIPTTPDAILHEWIERYRLYGRGLSWFDVHILVSCARAGARLVTRDATLAAIASKLGVRR